MLVKFARQSRTIYTLSVLLLGSTLKLPQFLKSYTVHKSSVNGRDLEKNKMQLANWSSKCPSKTATAGQNLLCTLGWGCTISSGTDLPVPEGKRPFGINRHRWEGDIKIFRKWDGGMDWIDLAQDMEKWRALVNAVTNLRVLLNAGNSLTS
jgi:hypothetical protein